MAYKKYTLDEITDLTIYDISKMTIGQLKNVHKIITRETNAKLKEWKTADVQPTTYVKEWQKLHATGRGGKVTTAGKTLNELRSSLTSQIQFNEAKTSTPKGLKEHMKATAERMGVKSYSKWDIKAQNDFWEIYQKIQEEFPAEFVYSKEDKGSQKYQNAIKYQNMIGNMFVTKKGKRRKQMKDPRTGKMIQATTDNILEVMKYEINKNNKTFAEQFNDSKLGS